MDTELLAVRRPFEAAFLRLCEADHLDGVRDEVSNALHHLYRLGELRRRRWATTSGGKPLTNSDFNQKAGPVPGVLGALWIRSFDTHEIASLISPGDAYADIYANTVAVWNSVSTMSFLGKPTGAMVDRCSDYVSALQDRVVIDTLRAVFDGLEKLV